MQCLPGSAVMSCVALRVAGKAEGAGDERLVDPCLGDATTESDPGWEADG